MVLHTFTWLCTRLIGKEMISLQRKARLIRIGNEVDVEAWHLKKLKLRYCIPNDDKRRKKVNWRRCQFWKYRFTCLTCPSGGGEVSLNNWHKVYFVWIQLLCLCWLSNSLVKSKPVKQEVRHTEWYFPYGECSLIIRLSLCQWVGLWVTTLEIGG